MNREDESWREPCRQASKEQAPQGEREKKLRRSGDDMPDVVLLLDDDDLLGTVGGKP